AAYVGTWEGQAASRDSLSIPLGTFRVTLKDAKAGERVGTVRHTDILGGVCEDVLTLERVSGKRLVAVAAGAESNRSVCDQARHTVVLTPTGDDLVYEAGGKAAGRPEARLATPRSPRPGTNGTAVADQPAALHSVPAAGRAAPGRRPARSRGAGRRGGRNPAERRVRWRIRRRW